MNTVELYAKDGCLFFKPTSEEAIAWFGDDGALIMYRYPAGDADSFRWPLDTQFRTEEEQRKQIAEAMSDARECGEIASNIRTAVLPDGSTIDLL